MDEIRIEPCHRLRGTITVPGDKSISHRLAMLAAIAEGETTIANFSTSADCQSTLNCLRSLKVRATFSHEGILTIHGRGLSGVQAPEGPLDAGNSGSTMRMLSGILAGQPFTSVLTGDESLCKRPMERIIEPLSRMGARFEARNERFPPLKVCGAPLHAISYPLPVPSAQVKTAILFAGLIAKGRTEVVETIPTRNHTEIALPQFGAEVELKFLSISVTGPKRLHGNNFIVPGDPSSAAFFVAAGLMASDSELTLKSVGLNPSRNQFFEFIKSMGGDIEFSSVRIQNGEPVGDVIVRSSDLTGGTVEPQHVPLLIDEIPILAVIGARSRQGLTVHGAQELRVKESDRIQALVHNLRALGVAVEEHQDGFEVRGRQKLKGAHLDSFGDHRIAMAFCIAALSADHPSVMHGARCVDISFPSFFHVLHTLRF